MLYNLNISIVTNQGSLFRHWWVDWTRGRRLSTLNPTSVNLASFQRGSFLFQSNWDILFPVAYFRSWWFLVYLGAEIRCGS